MAFRYRNSYDNSNYFRRNSENCLSRYSLYSSAADILKSVLLKKSSLTSLLYSSSYKRKDQLKAIVYHTLLHKNAVSEVIKHVNEFKKFKGDEFLALVLVYELLFGRKDKLAESLEGNFVIKFEEKLKKAFQNLQNEASKKGIALIPEVQMPGDIIPRYVRINTLLTSIDTVIAAVKEQGFQQISYNKSISYEHYLNLVKSLKEYEFVQDLHFSELLVFPPSTSFYNSVLVHKCHILLQDKSSLLPVHALSPVPGSLVLDACAAPGLKTSHIAALMQNKGKIIAVEIDSNRFNSLSKTLQQTGVTCCNAQLYDFLAINPRLAPFCDVQFILLDPSCSGGGMVKRGDALLDDLPVSEERLKTLVGFQIKALKHALRFPSVKRVVYSTCALTLEENEKVIEEVLGKLEAWFQLKRVFPEWKSRGSSEVKCGDDCIRASPDKDLTNGFFVAVIERIKAIGGKCIAQDSFNDKQPKESNSKNEKWKIELGTTGYLVNVKPLTGNISKQNEALQQMPNTSPQEHTELGNHLQATKKHKKKLKHNNKVFNECNKNEQKEIKIVQTEDLLPSKSYDCVSDNNHFRKVEEIPKKHKKKSKHQNNDLEEHTIRDDAKNLSKDENPIAHEQYSDVLIKHKKQKNLEQSAKGLEDHPTEDDGEDFISKNETVLSSIEPMVAKENNETDKGSVVKLHKKHKKSKRKDKVVQEGDTCVTNKEEDAEIVVLALETNINQGVDSLDTVEKISDPEVMIVKNENKPDLDKKRAKKLKKKHQLNSIEKDQSGASMGNTKQIVESDIEITDVVIPQKKHKKQKQSKDEKMNANNSNKEIGDNSDIVLLDDFENAGYSKKKRKDRGKENQLQSNDEIQALSLSPKRKSKNTKHGPAVFDKSKLSDLEVIGIESFETENLSLKKEKKRKLAADPNCTEMDETCHVLAVNEIPAIDIENEDSSFSIKRKKRKHKKCENSEIKQDETDGVLFLESVEGDSVKKKRKHLKETELVEVN